MSVYIGIFSNKGKIIQNDADALLYAFEQCGIEPSGGWNRIDNEFRRMLLEWFYSGNWICQEPPGRHNDAPG